MPGNPEVFPAVHNICRDLLIDDGSRCSTCRASNVSQDRAASAVEQAMKKAPSSDWFPNIHHTGGMTKHHVTRMVTVD